MDKQMLKRIQNPAKNKFNFLLEGITFVFKVQSILYQQGHIGYITRLGQGKGSFIELGTDLKMGECPALCEITQKYA